MTSEIIQTLEKNINELIERNKELLEENKKLKKLIGHSQSFLQLIDLGCDQLIAAGGKYPVFTELKAKCLEVYNSINLVLEQLNKE